MTVSGQYSFDPDLGSLTIQAFHMCGVRPAALTQEHMTSARMATNFMLSRLSALGVNTWMVSLETVPLVEGTATYNIEANNIVMLDTYVRTTVNGVSTDRIILPISRSEFAAYPNKSQPGQVNVYWQDRQIASTVTLWPVPDGTQTSLIYYQVAQIDDANFTNGQTVNVPYYFQECIVTGLAHRLSIMWAPDKAVMLKALFDESYDIASRQDIETSSFFVAPMLASYYR